MVTVISPGLGMTTAVKVLVPVVVDCVGKVIFSANTVLVVAVTVLTSPPSVGNIVKNGTLVTVPFVVISETSVVGSAATVVTKVVANDEVLMTSDVTTVEITEVKITVDIWMVK